MDSHQTFADDIKIESDFVQFDQPWDISHQQYDGYRNPLDWTMSSTEGTSSSNINDELEDEKENIEVAFLEAKKQISGWILKNTELKAQNCALKEEVEQKANEFAQLEQKHQKEKREMKERIELLEKQLKDAEGKAQMANNQAENLERNENFPMEVAILDDEQQNETIYWQDQEVNFVGKRLVVDPKATRWRATKTKVKISEDGLQAKNTDRRQYGHYIFAEQEFGPSPSAEHFRRDPFAGTILHYFEVTKSTISDSAICIGLSNGHIPAFNEFWDAPNCYVFKSWKNYCYFSGNRHPFEWPTGAKRPKLNGEKAGDVLGCGILLNVQNEWSLFFTANGVLFGKQIPLNWRMEDPPLLYPTIAIRDVSVEVNFGDDLATPFKYNVEICPGLDFE